MQVGKTVFFVLRSWSPKLAKSFAGRGMLVRPVLVYEFPRQRIKPTDVASHLYQHSQIATPNPVSGKPHKQMLATPLYSKCILLTPPSLNSYPCAYSICVPRHPCPLSSPSSCDSPARDCTYSRRCSLWSSRCCFAVSVSFSGSSIPRNHRAATTHEDDGAATTRHKSAV